MRRREFITFLGGGTVAWSLAAYGQQPERVRRIGSLTAFAETDMEVQTWYAAFRKRLDELGWVEGHNIHIDYRWGAGNVERVQVFAKELVRLNPEVISPVLLPPLPRCRRRPTRYRLCLRAYPIRLAADLSRAWHVQAATSPDSSILRLRWSANGLT